MTKDEALKIYNETNKKLKVFRLTGFLSSWDAETEAPDGAVEYRSETLGTMSKMTYEMSQSDEYRTAIKTLYDNRKLLDEILAFEIEQAQKDIVKMGKIPVEDYVEFTKLLNSVGPVYVKAKKTNNFSLYKPYLEKIISFKKKYLKWQETDELKGYDILLDEFEPDMTTKEYDKFFDLLKEKLVPFIKKIADKKLTYNKALDDEHYPTDKQKEFCKYIGKVMCFNKEYTVIKESEHPFTNGFGNKDVRITNHYHENNLQSSIFSAIHEMGHGLYELQVSDEIDKTECGGGASMAMHESQSRFMENMIGRSEAFWKMHFPKLKELFSNQLKYVTIKDFINYVNKVECSLIRTEADELTYAMHIIVRYELEKEILSGELKTDDIPAAWNKKYKEYLGVNVPDYTSGVLQDIHWSYGEMGYFPTYALGSAYAAQIYHAMSKDIDIDKALEKGTIEDLALWLKEHLHKYGASKKPKELIKIATGEDFNPKYFVDYLINKYSKIYNV